MDIKYKNLEHLWMRKNEKSIFFILCGKYKYIWKCHDYSNISIRNDCVPGAQYHDVYHILDYLI